MPNITKTNRVLTITLIILLALTIFFLFRTTTNNITAASIVDLQEQLEEKDSNLDSLKDQISPLNQQILDLKNQLSNPILTETKEEPKKINLLTWKISDVVDALKVNSVEFNSSRSYTYIYNDDCTFFEREGQIYDKDPFCDLVYSKINLEFSESHLRIFKLDNSNLETANAQYEGYIAKIRVKENVDRDLKCEYRTDCSGIKVIKCKKENQIYTNWYTDAFLFITRSVKDDDFLLNVFKGFYC